MPGQVVGERTDRRALGEVDGQVDGGAERGDVGGNVWRGAGRRERWGAGVTDEPEEEPFHDADAH